MHGHGHGREGGRRSIRCGIKTDVGDGKGEGTELVELREFRGRGGWLGGGKEVGGYAPPSTPFTYNAQNPIYTHTYM